MYEIEEIADKALSYNCEHIVITGGEPYLQKAFVELIDLIKAKNPETVITVETNGTIYKDTKADFISISPKLNGSSKDPIHGANHDKKRINLESLSKFIEKHDCQLKFVINDDVDIIEVKSLVKILTDMTGINVNSRVWVMPQGTEETQLQAKMKWLWDICKEYKWRYTDRLHVRCYGHLKGV